MDHKQRIPHEGVTEDGLPNDALVDDTDTDTEGHGQFVPDENRGDEAGPESARNAEDADTEGHSGRSADGLTVNLGTGGDFSPRRPSTGGEFIDENDVEGHSGRSADGLTVNPGTGGDFSPRRPSTGREFLDEHDPAGR